MFKLISIRSPDGPSIHLFTQPFHHYFGRSVTQSYIQSANSLKILPLFLLASSTLSKGQDFIPWHVKYCRRIYKDGHQDCCNQLSAVPSSKALRLDTGKENFVELLRNRFKSNMLILAHTRKPIPPSCMVQILNRYPSACSTRLHILMIIKSAIMNPSSWISLFSQKVSK